MSEQVDHRVARYMADVAAALEAVPVCDVDYGQFWAGEVPITFDGEPTGYAIVADDHGGYALVFDAPTSPLGADGREGAGE